MDELKIPSKTLQPFKLILGTSSVARRQIVTEMGYDFTVVTADIDEKGIRRDNPAELVMAIAHAKADAIVSKLQLSSENTQEKTGKQTLLLTADTVVVYDGIVREKPNTKEEAYKFLRDYSGGHAATVGSILVTNLSTEVKKGDWDRVEICFHEIPEDTINNLIEEGLVLNAAGGLIIEHPLIQPCVKAIVGGSDSVMGLSKAVAEKLIKSVLVRM